MSRDTIAGSKARSPSIRKKSSSIRCAAAANDANVFVVAKAGLATVSISMSARRRAAPAPWDDRT
jgi:hypothetical protein